MTEYRTRPLRAYGWPIVSSLLWILSYYPLHLEPLIWMAAVPLLVWLADAQRTRREAAIGLGLAGALYHAGVLAPLMTLGWWGWGTTRQADALWGLVLQRVFMAVLVIGVSVWSGIAFAALGLWMRWCLVRPLISVWLVPCVWVVLLEYVGHSSVFGFTWGLVGNRLTASETLRQVAAVGGVYALSALVMVVNAAVAAWGVWLRQRGKADRPRLSHVAGATAMMGIIMATAVAYGHNALREAESGPQVPVALLQAARATYVEQDFTPEGLDRLYAPLTAHAIARGARLIVLPEAVWLRTLQLDGTTTPWDADAITPDQMHARIADTLAGSGAVMVIGIDTVRGSRMYNTMTIWNAQGLLGTYEKRRLVPFSEYRPALVGRWAPASRLHGPQFRYTPGSSSHPIQVGAMTIGGFICQEVMYPALVRQTVRQGAEVLVTIGNDGVFLGPAVAREQANMATLRAVEEGRYVLRAMKTGISAVIDPRGRVLTWAKVGVQAVVMGSVRPLNHLTLYARWGDWVIWCGAAGLILGLALRRRGVYKPSGPHV